MSRKFAGITLGALVAVGGVTGCVSKEDYTALRMQRDALAEQLGQSEREASARARESDALKEQLARVSAGDQATTAMVANLQQQNANLKAQLDAINAKYTDALGMIGTGPALPEDLTNELTQFAAANGDLVEFDAERGMVKFKSDVTFPSGDATINPQAKPAIERFAEILNGSVAKNYELIVAGHTDNVPVSNPLTIKKGHKDNWHLSSHRAIAVADALIDRGVSKNRLGVTGYADQRPVASNTSVAGRAANRRVEVLILPTQAKGSVVEAAPKGTTPSTPAAPAQTETATTDYNPALNK